MRIDDQLLFEHERFKERVNSLYKKLEDPSVLKAFINNPTESLSNELFPEDSNKLSSQNISNTNRLLFSILSNKQFFDWALKYQNELANKRESDGDIKEDQNKVLQDIAEAFVRYGNKELIMSLMLFNNKNFGVKPPNPNTPDIGFYYVSLSVDVNVIAYVEVVIAAAVGAIVVAVALFPISKPNHLTNFKGIPINPQQVRLISERLIAHANKLKKAEKLIDPNYDFS